MHIFYKALFVASVLAQDNPGPPIGTVEGSPSTIVELKGYDNPPDGMSILSQTWNLCCSDDCDWRSYILQDGSSRLVFTAPLPGTWRPSYTVVYVNWETRESTTSQLMYTINIRGPPVVEPPDPVEPPPVDPPDPTTPPADQRTGVYVYESYDMTAPLYLNPARQDLSSVPMKLLILDKDSEGAQTPTLAIEAAIANGLPAIVAVLSSDGSVLAVEDDPGSAEGIVEFLTREEYADAD